MSFQPRPAKAVPREINLGRLEPSPQVLAVNGVNDVRDIVFWLLRLKGYRALANADSTVAQTLLSMEFPVVVVSDRPQSVSDDWGVLAFCHAHHLHIPVLIVSRAELSKQPEIERWTADFQPRKVDANQFRIALQRLTFYAVGRR